MTSTGSVRPTASEATPISHGEAASPSRCITPVVTANPRARRSAGSTLAIAALSGPMFTKSSSSVRNVAGQKIAGDGASTAGSVKASEATSDQPDSTKCAPGIRRASASLSRPPARVPMKPAATRIRPNVEAAPASVRPRSRTK